MYKCDFTAYWANYFISHKVLFQTRSDIQVKISEVFTFHGATLGSEDTTGCNRQPSQINALLLYGGKAPRYQQNDSQRMKDEIKQIHTLYKELELFMERRAVILNEM